MRALAILPLALALFACRSPSEPSAPNEPSAPPSPVAPTATDPSDPVGAPERDQEGPLAHASDNKSVAGEWFWTGWPGETLPDPSRYSIAFGADGSASVVVDCNRGRTSYQRKDGALSIGAPGLTKKGCPSPAVDRRFIDGLTATANAEANDQFLLTTNADRQPLALFAKSAKTALKRFQCADGRNFVAGFGETSMTVVLDGQLHTLTRLPDYIEERWADGIYEFRGKDGAITLTGRGPTLRDCKAQ
jgi:heat shock protein HslJ